jgi:periplasmic protein TonB
MQFQPQAEPSRRRFASAGVSIALHLLVIGWLLYSSAPKILKTTSAVNGVGETYIAHLYLPNQKPLTANDTEGTTAGAIQDSTRTHKQLVWRARQKAAAQANKLALSKLQPETSQAVGSVSETHIGGYSHGAALDSAADDEIRIALPINSSDPVVESGELGGRQGDVIVEITIDDKGNIIAKQVIQSFSPAIDNKVMAALETWRFTPATRNGQPIASKQDVHYHFPRSQQ